MQGDLADLPLLGVLELMHFSRKTGVLDVDGAIPFSLAFVGGEIVEGGILDWVGTDAILSLPLAPERGRFVFTSNESGGPAIKPFSRLMGDWAHLADEWRRVCSVIGSPSRVLRGNFGTYDEGRSVRAVARTSGQPLFEAAKQASEAMAAGKLAPTDRYAWHVLRLRHPKSRSGEPLKNGSLERLLDGQRNLGELIAEGHKPADIRAFLLREIRAGLRFPGAGWVLRDLTWETESAGERVPA